MKRFVRDQRGVTLVELLCSIAILSLVAVASTMLLMFCIRTNSFVTTGSADTIRAKQLNKRLDAFFSESVLEFSDSEVTIDGKKLCWNEELHSLSLKDGEEMLQVFSDELLSFEITPVDGSKTLVSVRFSFSDKHSFQKIFKVEEVTLNVD